MSRAAGAALHHTRKIGDIYLVRFTYGSAELHVRGTTAEIVALFVEPAHRGKGLSVQYISEALQLAQRHGAHTVVAHVAPSNAPSMRAFERVGFKVTDTERHMEFEFAGCAGGQS